MNHNVFVIIYGDNKVIITDVKSEAMNCVQDLIGGLTSFKVLVYNTVSDYVIKA